MGRYYIPDRKLQTLTGTEVLLYLLHFSIIGFCNGVGTGGEGGGAISVPDTNGTPHPCSIAIHVDVFLFSYP